MSQRPVATSQRDTFRREADDKRKQFLDLSREIGFGLHVFDYNFLMDDLIDLVRGQSEAMAKAKP